MMRGAVLLSLLSAALALPHLYQFNAWKTEHGKEYTTATEELKKLTVFMDNMKFIEEYNNRADTRMTLGLNEYADMTHEEFKQQMLGTVNATRENWAQMQAEATTHLDPENVQAPKTVDWRTKGYVTPVKNQGYCGSCYSFSTSGSLEGQWKRKSGVLVSLSEQQIVDCSRAYGNNGCNGGLMTSSFQYIKQAGGLETERAYPYEGQVNMCRFKPAFVGAKVTGYSVPAPSERSLAGALAAVGPVSVAIDASHRSLQFYKGGVYYEPACSSWALDHAVLAVGYGSNGGQNYWIIKNSWGTSWGLNGYFHLLKDHFNHCGVASMTCYPLV